jgi:MFS family permease
MVSTAGTQMRLVAVNIQVYALTKDSFGLDPALALGLLGLARAVPLVLLALISGLVADRLDRRFLIIVTAIGAFISSAVLAIITSLNFTPLWLIYTMVILAAVTGAFEVPARQALIANLVPPSALSNAYSLSFSVNQVAMVVGPSLAGVLIALYGVGLVYWIDALSFTAVVIAALMMHIVKTTRRSEPVTLQAALEGFRFVLHTRLIASSMLLDFLASFFGAATVLLPLFADQVLHVGAVELGWLYTAPSVGAVLAAMVLTSISVTRQGPVLLWSVVLFGICTAIFGLSTSLPLTLLALFGTGVFDTISTIIRQTLRQALTPDELRGRMTAVNQIFVAGGPRLGELESGIVASLIGGPAAVFLGGILCILMVGVIANRVEELRRYDGLAELAR